MAEKTYRIGDVAEQLQLKSYVLRFWETEFSQLAPLRTGKGQRLYTEEHVSLLKRIKNLLHEQGMTIDGARRVLQSEQGRKWQETAQTAPAQSLAPAQSASLPSAAIEEIRNELLELRQMLTRTCDLLSD